MKRHENKISTRGFNLNMSPFYKSNLIKEIMRHFVYTILFSATLLLSGCSDDLTRDNPNQITAETYWKTANDALAGVNAIYSTLHRGAISRWLFFYTIIRSDEGTSTSPNPAIVNNMQQFIVTDYNYGECYGIWNDNYIGINRANQVIDYLPAIEMNQALKDQYMGEALFFRAYFYFNLASLWGNVPLFTKTQVATDKPATTSQDLIWAQVETDLNEAAKLLPVKYTGKDLGRVTRGAAYALLAKAYMQHQKYNEALTPLQWLVEGEGKNIYGLVSDYRENFMITSENNKESVFEWQFAENLSETTDDDIATPNHNYGTSIAKFFSPSGIGWSDGEALRWPVYEFLSETTTTGDRDPRLAATFIYDSTDERGGAFTNVYGASFNSRYPNSQRIWFRKFLNDHYKNEEDYRSQNNYRFIRYADVLLMYAECLNATGSTNDAYQYVDMVRNRAGLASLSVIKPGMSQAAFLEQIKHERLTELCGEGHRWNDLVRWGELGPGLAERDPGFENFKVGRDELLPIPQQEIDINPNLDQNPEW
ncbi:MAG: RagB/SusD family nutrient uptake outer membrane protein [Bacteroidales bacterium]|nr:RagB/SusD family nutrient uptake outer membrane protein [Bacteroidales bacterium]